MSSLAARRSALRCRAASGTSSGRAASVSLGGAATASPSRCLHWRPFIPRGHGLLLTTTAPQQQQQGAHVPAPNHSQRRVLQTSSTSSSPSPPNSSPAAHPHSHSPSTDPHALRRSFPRLALGRTRRFRYTYLPAIIMGSANQTRDANGDHHPKDSKLNGHSHDHSHGHSHSHGLGGHHHHHDNSYLISKNRSDPGVRITNIGLLSNLTMAIAKFIGGWAFNSKAMVADGWHSLTDLASDVLTLATVSWSIKPPTDRFPLGFGKVESLGALGVSGLLLVGGCYMGLESAVSLYAHFNPHDVHGLMSHVGHGHSHSHSADALGIPSIHAAWIAAGTVVVKEWLYHATMKVARERQSSVLASNAIHHRVDSLTGIVTLVAIVGANVITNAGWLDPVGGLLISIMVVHAGAGNMINAFCELADQSIDEEVKLNVRKQVQKAITSFDASHEVELRDVSGVKSGPNYLLDLEMAVPGAWSVDHLREMEEAIRERVGAKVRGAKRVRVRFTSQQEPVINKFDEFVTRSTDRTGDPEPEHDDDLSDADTEGKHDAHDHKHHKH